MGCGASNGTARTPTVVEEFDCVSRAAPSAASLRSVTAPSVATSRRTASSLSSRPPVLLGSMTSEQRQVLQGAELTTPEQRAFRSLMVSGDNGKLPIPCSNGTFKMMRLRMWLDGEAPTVVTGNNAESEEADRVSRPFANVTAEEVSTNHKLCSKLEYRGLIEARAALFDRDSLENTGLSSQSPGVSASLSGSFVLSLAPSPRRLNSSLNVGVSSLSVVSSRRFSSITSPKAPQLLPSSHPSRRHMGSGYRTGLHRRQILDTY